MRWTNKRSVSCDGGGGPLGHPRIFINVDKPQICWCTYCGVPYVCMLAYAERDTVLTWHRHTRTTASSWRVCLRPLTRLILSKTQRRFLLQSALARLALPSPTRLLPVHHSSRDRLRTLYTEICTGIVHASNVSFREVKVTRVYLKPNEVLGMVAPGTDKMSHATITPALNRNTSSHS